MNENENKNIILKGKYLTWIPLTNSDLFEQAFLYGCSPYRLVYQSDFERFVTNILKQTSHFLDIPYSNLLLLYEQENKGLVEKIKKVYRENSALSIYNDKLLELLAEVKIPSVSKLQLALHTYSSLSKEDQEKMRTLLKKQ